MTLKNKVALITGGAQGLGKAIALAMAREGSNIVICDINASTLPVVQAEIEASGEPTLRATVTIWSARPSARTGHDRMTLER